MDFLDSLKQIKNDIKENEKKQQELAAKSEIAKKEEELRQDFIKYMKDSGIKEIK